MYCKEKGNGNSVLLCLKWGLSALLCSYNIGFRESYHSMFHDDVVIKEVVACRLQCPKLFLLPVRLPDKLMPP